MPLRIVFRVDASSAIGLGHVRRCLTLARELQKCRHECAFVVRRDDVDIEALMAEFAPNTILLPDTGRKITEDYATWLGVQQKQDASEFLASIGHGQFDWVIVDHYGINSAWHKTIKERMGCQIAVIDDLANRQLFADIIIDQNWHANHRIKYRHVNLRDAPILGGPTYALLDDAFGSGAKWRSRSEVNSIGVFMGGTDAAGASVDVLDMLYDAGFSGEIAIATGSANPHLASLKKRVSLLSQASLHIDLPNLAGFFAKHDLQIGAGGSATWERFCIGVPTIALVCADNQREILFDTAKAGYQWGAELCDKALQKDLLKAAMSDRVARDSMSAACRELVDGRGANRVARIFSNELPATIHVRKVTNDDALLIYGWRNHPAIRSVSRGSEQISFDHHKRWLSSSLGMQTRLLLLGETETGAGIGVVRFDETGHDVFEVSIYLDPNSLGRGLGTSLLAAAEQYLMCKRKSSVDIHAFTMSGNTPSEQLFLRSGYRRLTDCFLKTINLQQELVQT